MIRVGFGIGIFFNVGLERKSRNPKDRDRDLKIPKFPGNPEKILGFLTIGIFRDFF